MSIQPDFPFVSGDSTRYFKYANDDDTIRGRIIQLLETSPGERCALCDFGVGLKNYLFEPLDKNTIKDIKDRIYKQIDRYEPSLSVVNLQLLVLDLNMSSTLYLRIVVQNIKTKTQNDLIFNYPIGK